MASSYEPLGLNWISAECPSAEIWPSLPAASGERSFVTCGKPSSFASAWFTTALNSGSAAVAVFDCTSTYSICSSSLKPASRMMWSALRASPTLTSFWSIVCMPIAPPMATEATTNASQPKMAVLRWRALQRPIRAAMFVLCFRGDMACGSWEGSLGTSQARSERRASQCGHQASSWCG